MGEKGEGSGGKGRELGMGYPLSTPSFLDHSVLHTLLGLFDM